MFNKKKKLPRKELALSAGKKFKTPKGNELRISVLTLDVHTDSNEFSLYISCLAFRRRRQKVAGVSDKTLQR